MLLVLVALSFPLDLELHLAAVDDPYFFQHLHDVESSLQAKLIDGTADFQFVEVKTITGGIHYYDSEYDTKGFRPEAYDAQPSLKQAADQRPLGRQCILQFENLSPNALSIELLNRSLQETIHIALGIQAQSIYRWSTFTEVGDGAAIAVIYPTGSVVLVWDGQLHVDVNLYSSSDQSKATADTFVALFSEKTALNKTLRDDQPRGPGRVVQFQDEIDGYQAETTIGKEEKEEGCINSEMEP